MRDGILKGTGNSRYLKTVQNALALYPTYEAFMAAFAAGTLPVDLNGINPAGWELVGTALNKGTLLHDLTAANLNLIPAEDATPAQVLEALRETSTKNTQNLLINADFRNPINSRGLVEYTGNGFRIDGWRSAAGSNIFRIENGFISVESTTTTRRGISQDIADFVSLIGKTVTLSALARSDSGSIQLASLVDSETITENSEDFINTDFTLLKWTFTVPAVINSTFSVGIYGKGSNAKWSAKAAKFEIGDQQTLASLDENGNWVLNDPPPNRVLEQLKCITSKANADDTYANMSVSCTKLLWENASPDSDFVPQTLSMDLSPYDSVLIVPVDFGIPLLVKVGEYDFLTRTRIKNQPAFVYRSCTVNTTGITFGNASTDPYDSYHQEPNRCNPKRIYGIKWVS